MMKTIIKQFIGEKQTGKKVLIITGVHGNEITPIYVIAVLLRAANKNESFSLKKIKSLTVINGLNISGIQNKCREVRYDNTNDLNRSFSNSPEQDYINILKEHINNSDVVIDIHSSPSCTEFALIDIDEFSNSLKKWCVKADVDVAFRFSGNNTIKRYCLENKKPSLTLEFNKIDSIDYTSIKRCIKIINNLLDTSDKVSLKMSKPNVKPLQEIKTYKSGIFVSLIENGKEVNKGECLGSVKDFKLSEVLQIEAPLSGKIITTPIEAIVNKGETLFLIQPK